MASHNLPSPPAEDGKAVLSRKNTSGSTSGQKTTKSANRTAKRASSSAAAVHHHEQLNVTAGIDSRHKRVWKACERCRMKKTKCDGEFPCKRCKDDGMICTAGIRKKVDYKQLPKGYAEVLENTQFALIATVHKLYSMVRNAQSWELPEPELNDRGLPVIHNIAQKLGCIRPNNEIEVPVRMSFPETDVDLRELQRQLWSQVRTENQAAGAGMHGQQKEGCDSHSEMDHSDSEQDYTHTQPRASMLSHDYRRQAFGGGASSSLTLSPQSFTGTTSTMDMDLSPTTELDSQGLPEFQAWSSFVPQGKSQPPPPGADVMAFMRHHGSLPVDVANPAYGLKQDFLASSNPDVMMGMGDPMIYSGFDGDLRL
ncbi:hypothetical protein DCS_01075 [Drechmeria coniospora]|uniref:Zn(2)-C6 fungal-type domain-containing protein n=1 Tax=Drechmeria coniospora TaxID=98403 RepID=A0A151GS97_DRECN|nr:hypothetical protein DCS_01075 [Drechmeria coniospora]KYK59941.1 hypothetical protein DCS_01075 [Drechmeria coniospora]ODA78733.1 hypothetical protein RJ55_06116 [Drechmeria coniospora]